jgi:Histone methylation protein DOT1
MWMTLSLPVELCHAYRFADHELVSQDLDHNHNYNGETAMITTSSGGGGVGVTLLADVAPPTSTLDCFQTSWQRTDEIVASYWEDNVGYSLPSQSKDDEDDNSHNTVNAQKDNHNRELTYGEVTILGGRQLAYEMGISTGATTGHNKEDACAGMNCNEPLGHCRHPYDNADDDDDDKKVATKKNVIFYDLGSGVGRLVTQMYLDQPWRIVKSVGIELSWERHEWALQALTGIQQTRWWWDSSSFSTTQDDSPDPASCRHRTADLVTNMTAHSRSNSTTTPYSIVTNPPLPIKFHHGNVLEVDWSDATHIFLSSLCFPQPVLDALQHSILKLDGNEDDDSGSRSTPQRRRRRRPQLRVVAALNRLELLKESGEWDERNAYIQMSWGPGTVKIYDRRI